MENLNIDNVTCLRHSGRPKKCRYSRVGGEIEGISTADPEKLGASAETALTHYTPWEISRFIFWDCLKSQVFERS